MSKNETHLTVVEDRAGEEALDLVAEVKALRARVEALESMAHNEHSLPQSTIDAIVTEALKRQHKHLSQTLALGKVLLEEQPT